MTNATPAPTTDAPMPDALLPVRMLNEFVYCPRLFHFMHVEGRWADNQFTEEGRAVHRRVDAFEHVLPNPQAPAGDTEPESTVDQPPVDEPPDGDPPPQVNRSVSLSSVTLRITAKLDLVSTAANEAVPVETKRGRVPDNPERSYEPERVQLMAQGLCRRPRSSEAMPPSAVALRRLHEGTSNRSNSTTPTRWIWFS